MLPQDNRLKEKNTVLDVFKTGFLTKTLFFNVYKKNTTPPPQLLVIVSRKITNKAHQRNLIKRRVNESFKELIPQIDQSVKLIIVANKKIIGKSYQEIKDEIEKTLTKQRNDKKSSNSNN